MSGASPLGKVGPGPGFLGQARSLPQPSCDGLGVVSQKAGLSRPGDIMLGQRAVSAGPTQGPIRFMRKAELHASRAAKPDERPQRAAYTPHVSSCLPREPVAPKPSQGHRAPTTSRTSRATS